jgi:hypothetical protein
MSDSLPNSDDEVTDTGEPARLILRRILKPVKFTPENKKIPVGPAKGMINAMNSRPWLGAAAQHANSVASIVTTPEETARAQMLADQPPREVSGEYHYPGGGYPRWGEGGGPPRQTLSVWQPGATARLYSESPLPSVLPQSTPKPKSGWGFWVLNALIFIALNAVILSLLNTIFKFW